jgi:hypothetical protein
MGMELGVAKSVQCLTTDWTTEVQATAEAKDFSCSLCVHASSETHPSSHPMGTEIPVPGVKHGREMMLTIHRRLVSTSGISRSFHSSPPCRLHSSSETAFTFTFCYVGMNMGRT